MLGDCWLIIRGLLGDYLGCIWHIRVYSGIRVNSSRTIQRSGVQPLIRTIHTPPPRQCGVIEHAFGDICLPLWCHGLQACRPLWRHTAKFEAANSSIVASRNLKWPVKWPQKRPKRGDGCGIRPKKYHCRAVHVPFSIARLAWHVRSRIASLHVVLLCLVLYSDRGDFPVMYCPAYYQPNSTSPPTQN